MPIIIHKDIPAFKALGKENIFVMEEARSIKQDIRPIEIAIVNLMPTKAVTETQLLRVLSNSPLQVNITLIQTKTYKSKNTSAEHLDKFYKSLDDVKCRKFDGMIVTGAPVETLEFEDVSYWDELKTIMDFAAKKVTSTIFICWGAQAALRYHFGIEKKLMENKLFGIFPHTRAAGAEFEPLLKGCDDVFYIPHSRFTFISEEDVRKEKQLLPLAFSPEAGSAIIKTRDNRMFFFTGHSEYDRDTLKFEYDRDCAAGMNMQKPVNYFREDGTVDVKWCSTANLIFTNWLNYYVYQLTPYNIEEIK